MVISRRRTLMGLVTLAALGLGAAFLARFVADHGVASFLLATALLLVGIVHGLAWRGSRAPIFVADLSGLQMRLGGATVELPWSEVEAVDVTARGWLGDGRLSVHARAELRVLAGGSLRRRFAVIVNRWLYDAAIVVPYGLNTRVSVPDILATLSRLSDGRAEVRTSEEREDEPLPTVEIAAPGDLQPLPVPETPIAGATTAPVRPAAPGSVSAPRTEVAGPRRLAAVVSALRAPAARRGLTAPAAGAEPATAGTLALSPEQATESLPEAAELRWRPPEETGEEPTALIGRPAAKVDLVSTSPGSAGSDVSLRAPSRERRSGSPALDRPGSEPIHRDGRPAEVAIGERIRDAREWLGMSVDDLAERTRIRPSVIEAIEVGDFSACGGDFYARGHLRMLADRLGIDTDPLLSGFDRYVASEPVSPRAVFDAELSRGVVRPTGAGARWGALITTVVLLLAAWAGAKIFFADSSGSPHTSGAGPGHQVATGAGRAPSINDPLIGNTVRPGAAATTTIRVAASGASARVVVRDSAMKVIYHGTLAAGQSARVSGRPPLRVMASDGGAVTVAMPGHPARPLGPAGHRAYRHFGG